MNRAPPLKCKKTTLHQGTWLNNKISPPLPKFDTLFFLLEPSQSSTFFVIVTAHISGIRATQSLDHYAMDMETRAHEAWRFEMTMKEHKQMLHELQNQLKT